MILTLALPQPYRYDNKLLLWCIEDAIDLAEGGGRASSLQSVVGHNLKLTKVGKLPTEQEGSFFLSTAIAAQEITVYRLLGETHYIVVGTDQGSIMIFDRCHSLLSTLLGSLLFRNLLLHIRSIICIASKRLTRTTS
jgi:hypothetical protein